MSKEIKMPQISEDAESGTIVEIMVSEGDTIEEEQSIIAVESDKASVEVPAESGGKVKAIKVSEGDEIHVGDVILVLESEDDGDEDEKDHEKTEEAESKKKEDEKDEDIEEDEESKESKPEKKKQIDEGGDVDSEDETEEDDDVNEPDQKETTSKKKSEEDEVTEDEDSGKKEKSADKQNKKEVPAAPSVRRMAREMNVDIYALKGSGPGERITADDVKAAANGHSKSSESQSTSTALPDFTQWGDVERKKMSGIRKATARSMSNAWQTIPHVTQFDKADITSLQDFMEQYESKAAKSGAKLTVTAILVKLSASALRAFPKFNASVDVKNQELIYKKYIHIGVAVDTENGLLVPVIRDADRKSVVKIALELNEVAEKAREGKLSTDEMKGGTFTVSNLGGIGGTQFTPIVYHPQVAILGVSRNQIEPVFENDKFVPKTMLPLSLSYDHRAVDGAEAARFLRWMCQVMEDPFVMLMEGGI